GERHADASDFPAAVGDAKLHRRVAPFEIPRAPIHFRAESKGLDRAKSFPYAFHHRLALSPGEDLAPTRNQIHQAAELELDGRQIGINIRVVEFTRGQNQFIGMVVKEFWAAVEEGRLVFITLENELFSATQSVAAVGKIRNHTADEKVRPAARGVKDPGEHGGGGGLAVSSSDDN